MWLSQLEELEHNLKYTQTQMGMNVPSLALASFVVMKIRKIV